MWREMAMAAIGEQFSDGVSIHDDIVGISVGRRERVDNIIIWNLDCKYASEARVIDTVRSLAGELDLTFRDYRRT